MQPVLSTKYSALPALRSGVFPDIVDPKLTIICLRETFFPRSKIDIKDWSSFIFYARFDCELQSSDDYQICG